MTRLIFEDFEDKCRHCEHDIEAETADMISDANVGMAWLHGGQDFGLAYDIECPRCGNTNDIRVTVTVTIQVAHEATGAS